MSDLVCTHGQIARSCERCDDARTIAELRATMATMVTPCESAKLQAELLGEVQELRADNERLRAWRQMHMGDTASLAGDVERARDEIDELSADNEQMAKENAEMVAEKVIAKRGVTGMVEEVQELRAELARSQDEVKILLAANPQMRLDGYRELGEKCFAMETAMLQAQAELATARAEARTLAGWVKCYAGDSAVLPSIVSKILARPVSAHEAGESKP